MFKCFLNSENGTKDSNFQLFALWLFEDLLSHFFEQPGSALASFFLELVPTKSAFVCEERELI